MSSPAAIQRGIERELAHYVSISPLARPPLTLQTQDEPSSLHYSDEQLRALYIDLFASSSQPLIDTSTDPPHDTLLALHERFNLDHGNVPIHEAIIDHLETAFIFIIADQTSLPKLGLVLDSEWEVIISAAVCVSKSTSIVLITCTARRWGYGVRPQSARTNDGG
jgi:hypothetical protein